MADLIDRAALLADMERTVVFSGRPGDEGMRNANKIIDRIKAAPAVDTVEVKHGKWNHVAGGRTICNQCGEYPLYDYFGKQKFSNYCPRCGAKMEGIECD